MGSSLRDRVEKFDFQAELMIEREKADIKLIMDKTVTIREFAFLKNYKDTTKAPYVVFVVDEHPQMFFFGGTVLTSRMMELDQEGYAEEIQKTGLPVLLQSRKSPTSGKTYTDVTFYPDDK